MYVFNQVIDKIPVYTNKLSGQDSSCINIGSIRFECFIITQNLTGTGSWHWGNQKAVSHAVSQQIVLDGLPIIPTFDRLVIP